MHEKHSFNQVASDSSNALDYLGSVPPRSSARQRATKHALFNVGSLTLFALSWLADRKRRRGLPLALETAGTATLCVGGWMGGTLAFRNQIGVDHRDANAGKWQESASPSGAPGRATWRFRTSARTKAAAL